MNTDKDNQVFICIYLCSFVFICGYILIFSMPEARYFRGSGFTTNGCV